MPCRKSRNARVGKADRRATKARPPPRPKPLWRDRAEARGKSERAKAGRHGAFTVDGLFGPELGTRTCALRTHFALRTPHALRTSHSARRIVSSMRRPLICANWKMYKTVHETVFYIKELRVLLKDVRDGGHCRRAAVYQRACRQRSGARQQPRDRRAGRVLGARGRVHRRGQRGDAARCRGRVRHRRPLRAPDALRRDGFDA